MATVVRLSSHAIRSSSSRRVKFATGGFFMNKQFVSIIVGLALIALAGCIAPGTPVLRVEPDRSLHFDEDEEELFVVIDNVGNGVLRWDVSIIGGDEWLDAAPRTGTGRGVVALTARRGDLEEGRTYSAQLVVTSNGGEERRTVTVSVAEEDPKEPGTPLDRVEDVTVTGFTVPEGTFDMVTTFSAVHEFAAHVDGEVGRLQIATGERPRTSPAAPAPHTPLPAAYEAAFVLSWTPVSDAEAYRVYVHDGDDVNVVATPPADEIEYSVDGDALFVVQGDFRSGEQKTYSVRAVAAEREDGPRSDTDTGVIIAPVGLLAPAAGTVVSGAPHFEWEVHPDAIAYGVYVAAGSVRDHVWHVVIADATDVDYPGDAPNAPALAPGDYLWFVTAAGPIVGGKVGGFALSTPWSFSVQ